MTASLIDQAFKECKAEGRPCLLTYTVCGDPSKKTSLYSTFSDLIGADLLN